MPVYEGARVQGPDERDGLEEALRRAFRQEGRPDKQLYRITSDVNEEKDLAAQQPDMVKSLHAKLDAWWKP